MANNPRKFSEKIALHNQKQAEGTAEFEKVLQEVFGAIKVCKFKILILIYNYIKYVLLLYNVLYTLKKSLRFIKRAKEGEGEGEREGKRQRSSYKHK